MTGAYDQPIMLDKSSRAVLDRVDDIIDEAMSRGDYRVITNQLRMLNALGQVSGLAKAKLLYETQIRWKHFPVDENYAFEDAMLLEAGISTETCRKYIPIWEFVVLNAALDEGQREVLMTKPIGALDLLTAAARDGELSEDDWEDVLTAPDKATIREIVRRVRGRVGPSEIAVVIMLHRDGRITARQGNTIAPIGMFALSVPGLTEEQQKIVDIARERIVRAAGLVVE